MMLDINIAPLKEGFIKYLPMGLLVAAIMAAEFLVVVWTKGRFGTDAFPVPPPHPQGYNNTEAVGEWLYTQFLLPFEVAGIILLVAIIAAIALTLRKRPEVKKQNPARQVAVRRDERVRLAQLKSEPKRGTGKDF